MSQAYCYTHKQKRIALELALDYHQRSSAEWPFLTKAEKAEITSTRQSILRTSFRPVRSYTGHTAPLVLAS